MDVAEVQAAITALYGPNPEESQRANAFLMEFVEKPVAWVVSMELLSTPRPPESASFDYLQYFSANALYTKVCKHWHQLDADHRNQLSTAILHLLRNKDHGSPFHGPGSSTTSPRLAGQPFPPAVMRRLFLALCAVAVRAANGVDAYVHEAFALGQGDGQHRHFFGSGPGAGDGQDAAVNTMLEMLQLLPEEVERADASRARRLELNEQVRAHTAAVLQAVEAVTTQCLDSPEAAGAAATGGVGGGPRVRLLLAAVACLRAWVRLGLSLSTLASDRPLLFSHLLRLVVGAGAGAAVAAAEEEATAVAGVALQLSCAACEFLSDIMAVAEYPRPVARGPAAEAVLQALLGLPPLFVAAMQADDEDSCVTLCNAAICFAHGEMGLVTEASGRGLGLVEFLLNLTGCPSRRVTILTLDFWLELQDVPVSERHPSLGRPVYVNLLDLLLSRCEYPADFDGSSGPDGLLALDDADAFKDLRDGAQGVKDVFVVIYYLLRADYFSGMVDRLKARQGSWQALEVTLLASTLVSREVRSRLDAGAATGGGGRGRGKGGAASISSSSSSSPRVGAAVAPSEAAEDAERTAALLRGILTELLTNASLSHTPWVLAAGCKFLGGYAYLLAGGAAARGQGGASAAAGGGAGAAGAGGQAGPDLLEVALHYLTAGLRQEEARQVAALSVRLLGAACERDIAASPGALEVLLQVLDAAMAARVPIEEKLTLTEAAARVITSLDAEAAAAVTGGGDGGGGAPPWGGGTGGAGGVWGMAGGVGGAVGRSSPSLARSSSPSSSPAPPSSSSPGSLLVRFAHPLLSTLAAALNTEHPNEQDVSEAFQLLAQLVRFLDVPEPPGAAVAAVGAGGGGQPGGAASAHISTQLVGHLWPMLEAAAVRLTRSEEVSAQLFSLLGKMLMSLRGVLERQVHIPTLLKLVLDCFDQHGHPPCLDCLATAVEVYGSGALGVGNDGGGDESSAVAAATFRPLLGQACTRAFSLVQAAPRPGELPHLTRALFDLLYRSLLFCPGALLGAGGGGAAGGAGGSAGGAAVAGGGVDLGTALALVTACVDAGNIERDSTRTALGFLSGLASCCGGKLEAYRGEVTAMLVGHGEGLTMRVFGALAGSSPSLLWPNLIDALHALLVAFMEPQGPQGVVYAHQWVYAALGDERIATVLGEEDRQHTMEAVFRLVTGGRQRFKALMLDFAKVCHKEMTLDSLLAYGMAG